MSRPKISVVVCTKNEEKYIGGCLRKLKKQRLLPEIIIIDGHSKDKTLKIARKYADKIKFDNNKGLADARNIGWKSAKADIVAYCDADAKPPRHWTKNISELLEKYDAVSGPFEPYDGAFKQKFGLKLWADLIPRLASVFGYNSIWGANMAFRKSLLRKERFKKKFLEDYELGSRLRNKNYRIKFTSKVRIKASSRRFFKSFHRLCFKEYVLNAIRIKRRREPKLDYWK